VPRPFTVERPAVFYTHHSIAMDIEDHPLAKTLPKATEAPSVQPGPQRFRVFAAREDAPATLEDFIYQGSCRYTSLRSTTPRSWLSPGHTPLWMSWASRRSCTAGLWC
jgi:hypothetical protein